MRYVIGAGLVLALMMGGPAYSQVAIGGSEGKDQDWGPNQKAEAQSAEAARRAKDIERDYNEVTKKTRPSNRVERSLGLDQTVHHGSKAEAVGSRPSARFLRADGSAP
jgi:hypothetical protein